MEAPEKLYFGERDEAILDIYSTKESDNEVEYTRTEAIIEKAAIWFNYNFIVHDEYGVISYSFDTVEETFKDFIEYMKGGKL